MAPPLRSERLYRPAQVAVLAVALGLRVAYVVHTAGYVPAHDDLAYDRLARGIARTGVYPGIPYPTAYRPPAYPYFLGFLYWIAGTGHARIWLARLVQAGEGTLLVGLLGALARRIWDRSASLATMAVTAVYLPLIAVGAGLFAGLQSAVLEVASILAVLHWRATGRWRWALAAGALAGVLTLTRANAFVVAVAVLAGAALYRPAWTRLGAALAAAGVTVAVVAVWTVRNLVVMHAFIPVSDEQGGTLAGTYNPVSAHDRAAPAYWHLLSQIPSYQRDVSGLIPGPEPVLQSRLLHLALGYAADHPGYVATVALWNTLRLAGLTGFAQARYDASLAGIASVTVADAGVICFWVVAALALAAAALGPVRRAVPGFVWAAAGMLALTVVLVNGEAPRLRIPIDPFVILLAGAGVGRVATLAGRRLRLRAARGRPAGPAA